MLAENASSNAPQINLGEILGWGVSGGMFKRDFVSDPRAVRHMAADVMSIAKNITGGACGGPGELNMGLPRQSTARKTDHFSKWILREKCSANNWRLFSDEIC